MKTISCQIISHILILFSLLQGEDIYGHPGYGGQMAFSDVKNAVGMAYLTNDLSVYGLGNDPKFLNLQTEFYKVIDTLKS